MKNNTILPFLLNISKTQTIITRIFDTGLGNGIGWNEFLILYHIHEAENQTMRRIDLADKIGITASGITRLLLPMEKIGLIKDAKNSDDARVRLVTIGKGGKEKLLDALDRLENLFEDYSTKEKMTEIKKTDTLLREIGGYLLMR